MPGWVFAELGGSSMRREPHDQELFKADRGDAEEYAGNDALVREVLQNALDAKAGDGPVRVRFSIHAAAFAPPPSRLEDYLARLRPEPTDRDSGSAGFLVIEDFGTRGLEGAIDRNSDPPAGHLDREDLYWFWRNVGRSGKTGNDLGRWGLGKVVYRAASRLRCMFALTVRVSDRQPLLLGQAVLSVHAHGGREYQPEGFWCDGVNAAGVPLPATDPALVAQFIDDWRLTRRGEPGLSVVVPAAATQLAAGRLAQAAAVGFFVRILRGDLVVEVADAAGVTRLDADTLADACGQMTWGGPVAAKRRVAPPVAFARHALAATQVETEVLGRTRVPAGFTDADLAPGRLAGLRDAFAAGQAVAVRVRVWLPRKSGDGEVGQIDVHLRRDTAGDRPDAYYVREGMTITKLKSTRATGEGVKALALVDPGPLARLLADTEEAAHNDWTTTDERPDRLWKEWKGRVKFVSGVVTALVEWLTPKATGRDFDLLREFFTTPLPAADPGSRRKPPPGKSVPPMPPPVAATTWYRLTERAGGFTVARNPLAPVPAGARLHVQVAYDLPAGDPLKKWCALDFDFGRKGLKTEGLQAKAAVRRGNLVELSALGDHFKFSASGFDRHRDLYVRVDDATDGIGGEA